MHRSDDDEIPAEPEGTAEAGRDHVYFFLRHRLAEWLRAERVDLYRRLPADFAAGVPLPARPASAWERRAPSDS